MVRVLKTQVALIDGSDDEYAIECPECHTRYVPLNELDGASVELPHGTMFAAYCPECGHGVYFNQLAEGIDDD